MCWFSRATRKMTGPPSLWERSLRRILVPLCVMCNERNMSHSHSLPKESHLSAVGERRRVDTGDWWNLIYLEIMESTITVFTLLACIHGITRKGQLFERISNIHFLIFTYNQLTYLHIDPPSSQEYYVFSGMIFTNGSRPVISSNISDERVVEKITGILNDYSEKKFVKKKYLSKKKISSASHHHTTDIIELKSSLRL